MKADDGGCGWPMVVAAVVVFLKACWAKMRSQDAYLDRLDAERRRHK